MYSCENCGAVFEVSFLEDGSAVECCPACGSVDVETDESEENDD